MLQMNKCFYCVFLPVLFFLIAPATAQKVDFEWVPSATEGFAMHPLLGIPDLPAYAPGLQAGAPSITGPFDLDGDGKMEVVLSDYSGAGRVHVLESAGVDTWELIYSSPSLAIDTGTLENARGVGVGDLDGDKLGEIYLFIGYGIADESPVKAVIPGPRLGVMEATGDNMFNPLPSLWDFDGAVPDRFLTEQITVADVDGDNIDELMFGNNGRENIFDSWYVVTAEGIGTPLATFTQEARWTSRPDEVDEVDRGGGSPFGIVAADFDGDGTHEIALHSWNNLNFTNIDVTGPNTYVSPSGEKAFYQASPFDDVAYFGCTVVDIDMNGDDEVYCVDNFAGDLAIINYEEGENPLEIGEENAVYPLVGGVSVWGLISGDIDNDGSPELIGSGAAYTPKDFADGKAPKLVRIVDYDGTGDVEASSSYKVREVEFPMPTETIFDTVNRDSAGVMTTYLATTYKDDLLGAPGIRAGKFAYLGDVDGDGQNEVAMSISGVPDSVYVYNEVFNPADSTYVRSVVSATPHPDRVFLKVLSGDGLSTSISNDRIILPTDFELHSNYPNPFNPSTSFSFTLPLDKRVSVRIYDITGRLVRTLIDGEFYAQGRHTVEWNGLSDRGLAVASGQYIYTLEWGQFRQTRHMVLVK